MHTTIRTLKSERTEYGKALRRLLGDNGGSPYRKVKRWVPSSLPYANTLTSCLKDNYLIYEFQNTNNNE